MIQEPQNKNWIVLIVAIISATGLICAAIIGLGVPFAERYADYYFSTPQSSSPQSSSNPVSPTETENQVPLNTPVSINSNNDIQPTPTVSSTVKYSGWVICWHGRDGYEYLIAYPESDVKQGVSLNYQLTNAQGRQLELANDSLKMCYVDGEWYGYPDPSPWFASVSYMQLLDKEILVCSDSPGCQGKQYTLLPEKYFPWNAPDLQAPNGTGVHVIDYKSSSQ